jgi:hypothetical protein
MNQWMRRSTSVWVRAMTACLAGIVAGWADTAVADEKPAPRGRAEFRMAADAAQDEAAVVAAREWFKGPKRQMVLQRIAQDGLAPPGPILANEDLPRFTWIELGPATLRAMGLDNAKEKATEGNDLWKAAAKARTQALPFVTDDKIVLWSRDCRAANLSAEERRAKKYEYFLLTKLPEPKNTFTGADLTDVTITDAADGIRFKVSKGAGDRVHDLTSGNKGRVLVVLVDGGVIFHAKIQAAIRSEGQLTGKFTKEELERIAAILRRDIPK